MDGIANIKKTADGIANIKKTADGIANLKKTADGIANIKKTADGIANIKKTAAVHFRISVDQKKENKYSIFSLYNFHGYEQ